MRQRVIATVGRLDHLKASGQMYRATGFLHDIRHELERELFFRDLNLFNQQLDLIFLDTPLPAGRQALPTSTRSAPSGPDVLGRNRLSYSHRL